MSQTDDALQYISEPEEIKKLLKQAKDESDQWREDYHEYERLADNDLIEDLDPSLPEVNDGSLAAALYKLPKRIVNSDLKGRAKALDTDDAWITELANLQWENEIIPNANSQAPFHRKWKDAVRKAAIYGSVPIITLFVERGDYTGTDFIVAQPQDVMLEPGKVSDYDSDLIFWEVYYTKQQVKQMLETAKKEMADKNEDGFNQWDIEALEDVLKTDAEDSRDSSDDHRERNDKSIRQSGIKFCVVFQRGINAPFYMYHSGTEKTVRTWTNQDPTGDIPVHFLYCYQDFINPYGTGIVKLAGGTQNVLDYMRQADVLATQLGFRPPIAVSGSTDGLDMDSLVYEQDAIWEVGQAQVQRQEISNQVYQALPSRMSMYKVALDQLLPVGDTSISAGSGDADYSKTPAGVKFQQQNLSIDDEDFKDNLYMTYEVVAKSMINIHFANMQGHDLMRLSDEERELLVKGGMDWPKDEQGQLIEVNEVDVIWDEVRSTFNYEIDAEQDKAKDDAQRLDALLKVVELRASDPTLDQALLEAGKKLNVGELFATIIQLTSDNDKIIEDISPEDKEQMDAQKAEGGAPEDYTPREELNYKDAPEDIKRQMELAAGYEPSSMVSPVQEANDIKKAQLGLQEQKQGQDVEMQQQQMAQQAQEGEQQPEQPEQPENASEEEQEAVNIQAIVEEYGVPENIAMAMREAEQQGLEDEEIMQLKDQLLEVEQGNE